MSVKLHLRRYFCGQARRATIALSSHLARIGFSPYRSIVPSIAIWSKAAYINMVPARDLGSARTKPISRRVVTTGTGREHVVDRRRNVRRLGEIAQSKLVVTESVEGYLDHQGHIQQYYLVQVADPNCSRKQWHFPSSGVHLRIREPWFDGDSGEP